MKNTVTLAALLALAACSKAPPPEPPPPISAADVCRAAAPVMVQWRDPASVRINLVKLEREFPQGYDAWTEPVALYVMLINAANGFGGMTGDKAFDCWVTMGSGAPRALSVTPI